MTKHLILLTMFIAAPFQTNADALRDIAIVTGTGVCVGGLVYAASCRDSNKTRIERAYQAITAYEDDVDCTLEEIDDFESMVYFSKNMHKTALHVWLRDVQAAYSGIATRYESYLTPWNWSTAMRDAYEAIKQLQDKVLLMQMICDSAHWLECCSSDGKKFSHEDMMHVARVKGCAFNQYARVSYPMMSVVAVLQQDIAKLQAMRFYGVVAQKLLLRVLQTACSVVMNSEKYQQEVRDKQEYELKLRMAEAAEKQARAAEKQAAAQAVQAAAQLRQASAQEEQNEIAKKKDHFDRWGW